MAVAYQDTSYGAENEYRIALIGRTGSGKSASGNSILGRKAFKSQSCGSSVTKRCEFQTAERFGKKLVVVDTPGLFDTELPQEVVAKEIIKCVGILTPGPHAFVLVVQAGRFTSEESDTVNYLSHIFGEEFFRYLIVLFTRKDDLEKNQTTIEEFVKGVSGDLKTFLWRCDHRYLAFDNISKGQSNDLDVQKLVRMVKGRKEETGKFYFSNGIFERAELEFQRRAKDIRVKGEENITKIQEEIETNRNEIEKLRREFQTEKAEIEARREELEIAEKRSKLEKRRHHQQIATMRDDDRRKYEIEDEGVIRMICAAVLAIGTTVWSLFSKYRKK